MTVNRRKYNQGFTLMEMLIVLVLIGLIAAVAIPQVTRLLGSAKSRAATLQMETLSASLRYYEIDNGAFPTTEQGLQVLWEAPADMVSWNGPYIRQEKLLKDPWNREFVYNAPANDAPYSLISLGADGAKGGTGDDADVTAIP
jgi:general secretion pathway protein G